MEVFVDDLVRGGTQKNFYKENERETINCINCGLNDCIKISTERGLGIVRCKACHVMYTNPRAINAELNYDGNIETFYNEARLIFKGKKKHHRDANYDHELKVIGKYKKKGKLLDIGSNMGFFLNKAQLLGYEVEGLEPSQALSEISRKEFNLSIHNSFLNKANLAKESYDVITLIDVFEHVSEPIDMLTQCHKILKSDGILVIKVPNGNYILYKMLISRFFGIKNIDIWNSCEHLGHYTTSTLSSMANKCGYEVKKITLPLPVHPPVWAHYVGQYFQYPSPTILDWRRILARTLFYYAGKIEQLLGLPIRHSPDLMFILMKK